MTNKKLSSVLGEVTQIDRWGYILLGIVGIAAIVIGYRDEIFFNEGFANEDGIVENLTTLALLSVAIICGNRLVRQWKKRDWMWLVGTALFILLFFFAAGEEISWGQRIFGWETNEYFMERNAQGETNLHNLVVGETKINKLIFSQLLTLVMAIYLLIVPLLHRRVEWIRRLIDGFAVPVVKGHHALVFILLTFVIMVIPAERKWEVYELGFGMMFILIFLNPYNSWVFKLERDPGENFP